MKPLMACIIVGCVNAIIVMLLNIYLHIDIIIMFVLLIWGSVSFVAESRLGDL